MPELNIQKQLDRLWGRIQDVARLGIELNSTQLDDEDKAQLDELTRVSSGYAYFLMECNSALENGDKVDPELIHEFSGLIDDFCDTTASAMEWTLREQQGRKPQPVVYA